VKSATASAIADEAQSKIGLRVRGTVIDARDGGVQISQPFYGIAEAILGCTPDG
jgi:hypothetical protein